MGRIVKLFKFIIGYILIQFDKGYSKSDKMVSFVHKGKLIKIRIPSLRDFISFTIVRNKSFFDIDHLVLIEKLNFQSGFVVIDAGSNIGNHAIYFAAIMNAGEVYCFEPQVDIFNILSTNIHLNNCQGKIHAFNTALGDKKTNASFKFREDVNLGVGIKQLNHGGVYLKEDEGGNFPIDTLDNILLEKLSRLDFIKLDVQGFEEKVITGASKIIEKFQPIIQVESMTFEELNEIILPLMDKINYKIKLVIEKDYIFIPI